MPAKSKNQQQFMGAELARKRAGKKTRTGMSVSQLEEFASVPRKGLPEKAPKPKPMPMKEKEMKKKMPMKQGKKGR